jgi:hypothetical protein
VTATDGAVTGQARLWLRAEGAATFVIAVFLYNSIDATWLLFALLFLAPDLSFAGYLAGPRAGAAIYNVVHSYVAPLLLAGAAVATASSPAVVLIWVAHIGLDRALGYGLKYPTGFSHTHLGRIGRPGDPPR